MPKSFLWSYLTISIDPIMTKVEVNEVTKHCKWTNPPTFPFKYYISKVGGGGVSDHALILLMQRGVGGLSLSKTCLCNT